MYVYNIHFCGELDKAALSKQRVVAVAERVHTVDRPLFCSFHLIILLSGFPMCHNW